MAKLYVGVNNIARKVSKVYVGVNGVARKVKTIYVGVGGTARKAYIGALPTLKQYSGSLYVGYNKNSGGGASIKTNLYGVFAGGFYYTSGQGQKAYGDVRAFDANLTYTDLDSFSTGVSNIGSASISKYAIFQGGKDSVNNIISTVHAYDNSLTHITISGLQRARQNAGSASNAYFAIFAGGFTTNQIGSICGLVDYYNTALSRSTADAMGSKVDMGCASFKDTSVSFFVAGRYSNTSMVNTVDVYNTMVKSSLSSVGTARGYLKGTDIGNYCIFGGGATISSNRQVASDVVDIFDKNYTRSTSTLYTATTNNVGAGSTDSYAIFFHTGGFTLFDEYLTKTKGLSSTYAWITESYCHAGKYILRGVGSRGGAYTNMVEAFYEE